MGVKWIKLSTNIFDDEKIKIIEASENGADTVYIWLRLLVLAGKTNDNGYIYMTDELPYTPSMLATLTGKGLDSVKSALAMLKQYQLIEIDDDNVIYILNWEKHQSAEKLAKIKEQTRKRVARHRLKQSQGEDVTQCNDNVTQDVTLQVTHGNATDIDRDIDRDNSSPSASARGVDIDVNNIMEQWNNLDPNITRIQAINPGTTRYKNLKARLNQYGTDSFITVIDNIKASAFLKGYVKDFIITFDWLVKPNNYIKVLEGNYNERATPANRQLSEDEKRRQVIENFLREENKN